MYLVCWWFLSVINSQIQLSLSCLYEFWSLRHYLQNSDYSLPCLPMTFWWLRCCQLDLVLYPWKDLTHYSLFIERFSCLQSLAFGLEVKEFKLNYGYLHPKQFGRTWCGMSGAMPKVGCGRILTLKENLAQNRGASGIIVAAITCSNHRFFCIFIYILLCSSFQSGCFELILYR